MALMSCDALNDAGLTDRDRDKGWNDAVHTDRDKDKGQVGGEVHCASGTRPHSSFPGRTSHPAGWGGSLVQVTCV